MFVSPLVKWDLISSIITFVCKFTSWVAKQLRTWDLRKLEILGKSTNGGDSLVPRLLSRNKILVIAARNDVKLDLSFFVLVLFCLIPLLCSINFWGGIVGVNYFYRYNLSQPSSNFNSLIFLYIQNLSKILCTNVKRVSSGKGPNLTIFCKHCLVFGLGQKEPPESLQFWLQVLFSRQLGFFNDQKQGYFRNFNHY